MIVFALTQQAPPILILALLILIYLTVLELRAADLLSLELALKLARLHGA